LILCSFFARPKNEPKKGAGNANYSLFGRPLHKALLALPKRLQFTPFPDLPSRRDLFNSLYANKVYFV
jgi:hypothetical protein